MRPTRDLSARGRTLLGRAALGVVVLLAGHLPVDVFSGSLPVPPGFDGQYSGRQGQILVVKVFADDTVTQAQGKFLGRSLNFFPETRSDEAKGFVGLLGIDLQDEPGS